MKFKDPRMSSEYIKLQTKNAQLYDIVSDIDKFSQEQLKKEIVLTSIFRSAEEQKAIYGYEKPSVHMYWRGVDLRSSIYTDGEISQLIEYANGKYEYDAKRPGKFQVALCHDVGAGKHLHIQNHSNTQLKSQSSSPASNKMKDGLKSLISAISFFIR